MSAPKLIPGIMTASAMPPPGMAPLDFGALQRAGLPLAPYVQYGQRGEPAIMMYGRDPYRGLEGIAESICGGEPAVRAATAQVRADARDLMRTSKWVTVGVAAAAGAVGSIAKGPVLGGLLAGGLAWLVFTAHAGTYDFN